MSELSVLAPPPVNGIQWRVERERGEREERVTESHGEQKKKKNSKSDPRVALWVFVWGILTAQFIHCLTDELKGKEFKPKFASMWRVVLRTLEQPPTTSHISCGFSQQPHTEIYQHIADSLRFDSIFPKLKSELYLLIILNPQKSCNLFRSFAKTGPLLQQSTVFIGGM